MYEISDKKQSVDKLISGMRLILSMAYRPEDSSILRWVKIITLYNY